MTQVFHFLTTNLSEQKARLKWACRRGMLELDLILNRFLTYHYDSLNIEEQATFRALTEASDNDLFNWLLNSASSPPLHYESLLKKIKDYSYV